MKRLSSITTNFRKKIIPLIILFNTLIVFCCLTFFNFRFNDLSDLIFPTMIFFFAWILSYRKLKVVYLDSKYLLADKEFVLIENIIEIKKIRWFYYRVKYKKDDTINYFIFMVDPFSFTVSENINKIMKR